ncbi:hypothetical protein DAEQUDRAFT_728425 [Daedalea quercina L-15889]|uniref:DUF6533 domain-containing protein n=1 Tax=Daedalea quercina L-15889 TaxID=1314783 RepID=A0A165P9E3_9APHY|nr:hypothetical protein DAEQUDRAFT_728425 [Daedalea quercina L-15889]
MTIEVPAAEIIPLLSSQLTQSCVNGVVIAFLLYDYVLTFGNEFDIIWCRRGPVVSRVVLFLLRLCILGTAITVLLFSYASEYATSVKSCSAVYDSATVFTLLANLVIAAITTIRAYAVTCSGRVVAIVTLALSIMPFVLDAYILSRTSYEIVAVESSLTCAISVDLSTSMNIIITLALSICNTLADVVVIVATWVCTWQTIRLQGWGHRWTRRSITWLLLRDGTVYFLAVFCLNLIDCVAGVSSNSLSYLANLITPLQLVLLSRLLINLREASERDMYMQSQYDEYFDETIAISHIAFGNSTTTSDEEAPGGGCSTIGSHGGKGDDGAAQMDVREESRGSFERRVTSSSATAIA